MSNQQPTIQLVQEPVEQYLANQLSATELVRIVDDLVAHDRLHGLTARLAEAVAKLHEVLALYVPDEPTREEEPGIYIGEDELRQQAATFIASVRLSPQAEAGA